MSTLFAADEARMLLDAAIKGDMPDDRGRFGPFGGRYVPETLVPAFERLEAGVKDRLEPGSGFSHGCLDSAGSAQPSLVSPLEISS